MQKYGVKSPQAVEKVLFLSLRAKRGNLAFNKINACDFGDVVSNYALFLDNQV
jgi:hypothetical protein